MKSISLKKILAFTFAAIMSFSLCACNNYDEMTSSADDEFYLTKEAEMDEATKAELTTISDTFENFLLIILYFILGDVILIVVHNIPHNR